MHVQRDKGAQRYGVFMLSVAISDFCMLQYKRVPTFPTMLHTRKWQDWTGGGEKEKANSNRAANKNIRKRPQKPNALRTMLMTVILILGVALCHLILLPPSSG